LRDVGLHGDVAIGQPVDDALGKKREAESRAGQIRLAGVLRKCLAEGRDREAEREDEGRRRAPQ
jgi:hypothetical protein